MKKLGKKGKVHPSPLLISDHLAFLPATIFTLTAALSLEDKEVLAYLISCSNFPTNKKANHKNSFKSVCGGGGASGKEHPPLFYCNCFRCYTSYWVRWDASPNRQLIHDVIDAFEDELLEKKKKKSKKDRKKKGCDNGSDDLKRFEDDSNRGKSSDQCESVVVSSVGDGDSCSNGGEGEEEAEFEQGSVRKLVSFIGETIWGVWKL
ncbi:hypothetical protein IFM89_017892 [Coptis chinensis]|uniref:Uncharacterized protein n=1 Tax=Coptis chinensis TaxID=261450 RepID=A0A835I477_9MAGN|nr:hypothetical protein IFM89_017892 [Coptis chinensis]